MVRMSTLSTSFVITNADAAFPNSVFAKTSSFSKTA